MPRPRFSEMLVTRRRQLGLSISQASQVLRLKEQVLIAFEEGDFDHIPKSGYAQGMLSSYARYLGLNPRQVVNQFQADLNEYAQANHPMESFDSDSTDYLAPKKLLPTSGGPAGDLGAFATTSQPHSRQQSSPLVTRRYVGTLHDEPERTYGYDTEEALYAAPQTQAQTHVEQRYGTLRQPTSASSTRSRASSTRTRRRSGERGSRAQAEGVGREDGGSRREAPRRRGGALGALMGVLSDRTRLITIGAALIAVLVIAGIALTVRSCSSGKEDESAKTVPVTSTTSATDDKGTENAQGNDATATDANATTTTTDPNAATTQTTATTDAQGQAGTATNAQGTTDATGNAATTTPTTTTTTAPKETKVQVKVDAGNVSWVEVLCDGESKIATTVTGPWSETYDVHESITVEVGDTAAVVVTENGVQRQFDSKSSGIGTITIQGTPEEKPAEGEKKKDEDADKKDSDEGEEKSDSTDSERNEAFDSSGDEFLYTYDGYDIYYNAENDVYYFYGDDGAMYDATDGTPL